MGRWPGLNFSVSGAVLIIVERRLKPFVRSTLFVAIVIATTACVDAPTGDVVSLFPRAIELASVPDEENRIRYEITGPTWEDPHRTVGDLVHVAEELPRVLPDGTFAARLDEPAPYVRGSEMSIRATLGAAWNDDEDLDIEWSVVGHLRSKTDPTWPPRRIVEAEGIAGRREGVDPVVSFDTDPLPERVDLFELRLEWTLRGEGDVAIDEVEGVTVHTVPTLLGRPQHDAPSYKQPLLWAAEWAAGEWDADDPETRHEVARRLTLGIKGLERQGRSYGRFPRPDRDLIDDRIDVYLDFPRSACGEHRGLLMGLIEYHGIDASWVWFRFPQPGDEGYVSGGNDRYRTRPVEAVGRSARRWSFSNHIVVSVDGRIYDPTHTVFADSWQDYEDSMFDEYCRREGLGLRCVPNPPGYAEDGVHPRVIFADNYK